MKYLCAIKEFLNTPASADIAALITLADNIQRLQAALIPHLPKELTDHIQLGAIHTDTLTLITDNPAWGNRLRFLQEEILLAINKIYKHERIQALKICVSPTLSVKPELEALTQCEKKMALSMRADSGQCLEALAESESDEQLREALLRLSRHGAPPAT